MSLEQPFEATVGNRLLQALANGLGQFRALTRNEEIEGRGVVQGQVLVDRQIQVAGPTDRLVTVYRGVDRETYSCMPVCQRRVTLGDGDNYFKSVLEQAGTMSSTASGSAASGPKAN